MVEVMQRDFNEDHMMQVPITENQLGTMQMMEEVSDHVGLNYPEISDSRFVAQPVETSSFSGRSQVQPKTPSHLMKLRVSQKQ